MSRTPTGGSTAAGGGASAASPTSTYQLAIRRPDSVLEVIGALWQREAAWGVWKGANASFLYGLLSSLLENWTRGVLSALFNVPDLGSVVAGAAGATAGSSGGAAEALMDRLADVAAPYPWASLAVAATAALATGLLLAPLDIVRTRYELSPRGTIYWFRLAKRKSADSSSRRHMCHQDGPSRLSAFYPLTFAHQLSSFLRPSILWSIRCLHSPLL